MSKRLFIIAGPNGAGKTTTAHSLMPTFGMGEDFINADEIAKEIAPERPERAALAASKLMIAELRTRLLTGKDFAFETTAAGINYLRYLTSAKESGYTINLIFLWLASADLAIKRVDARVAQGGHYIEEAVIRRRYLAGLRNIVKYYLPLADSALILDNSEAESKKVIAEKTLTTGLEVRDLEIWQNIRRVADG